MGIVAIRSATSQRLRLDSKCGVPPWTECSGASHGPDRHGSALVARRTNDTDGDSHNTSQGLGPRSGRTLPIATLCVRRCRPRRNDRNFSLPAQHGRNSTMNSAVANPGCERTTRTITRCANVVNRTLVFFHGILDFFQNRPMRAHNHSQHGDWVDVDRQFDAMRGRMLAGYRVRQRLKRPRVGAAQLEVESIQVSDLDDRRRGRSEDSDGR
jgi:hypothetical protein